MTFRPPQQASRSEQRREYDLRRGTAASRGYDSRWAKAARGFRRSHSICLGCEAAGRVAPSDLVDHIVPHRGDRDLFWNRDNWQACCTWHHDAVKARLERMWDAGEISADDLRLDSAVAIGLTRDLDPRL